MLGLRYMFALQISAIAQLCRALDLKGMRQIINIIAISQVGVF